MSGMPPNENTIAYIDSSRRRAMVSSPGFPAASALSIPHKDAALPEIRASPVAGFC
jgi:hypothetical protein